MLTPSTENTPIPVSVTHSVMDEVAKTPIVFMGTPDFAALILRGLIESGYTIVGVVTQTDKPVGRKQVMTPSAVKVLAQEHKLPLLQPEKLTPEAVKAIADWKPELIVVAAYGKILPKSLLALPKFGALNVHASLLPKWRGASPIQNALIAGDTVTGITLIQINEGVDTGAMIAQKSTTIDPDETTALLTERLANEGRDLLLEYLPSWIKKEITLQPQKEREATLCQLIEREDGRVFWSASAEEIYNRYRGLSPWPGIFAYWKKGDDRLRLKLLRISLQKTSPVMETALGTVFEVGEKIAVRTRVGIIFLEEVQLEGKEPVPIREFINGNPEFMGTVLA